MALQDLIRRPLHKIAPQIAAVLSDPAESLAREPVVIGDQLLMPVIGLGLALGLTYLFSDPSVELLFVAAETVPASAATPTTTAVRSAI